MVDPPLRDPDREGALSADMPRWVKVIGILGIALFVLVVTLHLTGHGLGGHVPSRDRNEHAPTEGRH